MCLRPVPLWSEESRPAPSWCSQPSFLPCSHCSALPDPPQQTPESSQTLGQSALQGCSQPSQALAQPVQPRPYLPLQGPAYCLPQPLSNACGTPDSAGPSS
eukprot:2682763-Rhodomonas_salina.2